MASSSTALCYWRLCPLSGDTLRSAVPAGFPVRSTPRQRKLAVPPQSKNCAISGLLSASSPSTASSETATRQAEIRHRHAPREKEIRRRLAINKSQRGGKKLLRSGHRISLRTIRHGSLRQALGVYDVVFLDDASQKELKGDHRVNLVRAERSSLSQRHGAVGI